MATVLEKPAEVEEAVIISGPRKGSIVTLNGDEAPLSEGEEAMLDAALVAMKRLAQSISETSGEARALHQDIARWREGKA